LLKKKYILENNNCIMLKIKLIFLGAIVFFILIGSIFFFIFPQIITQTNSIKETGEEFSIRNSWKNQSPLAIINYMRKENALLTIIKNNSNTPLTFEKICISNNQCTSNKNILTKNETIAILIDIGIDCKFGEKFVFEPDEISLDYSINEKLYKQITTLPILGTCS